jgi:hypothetical protein
MSRFDTQHRDFLRESAMRSNESQFPSYHVPDQEAVSRFVFWAIVIGSGLVLMAVGLAMGGL